MAAAAAEADDDEEEDEDFSAGDDSGSDSDSGGDSSDAEMIAEENIPAAAFDKKKGKRGALGPGAGPGGWCC
jgi:hypothetical protein